MKAISIVGHTKGTLVNPTTILSIRRGGGGGRTNNTKTSFVCLLVAVVLILTHTLVAIISFQYGYKEGTFSTEQLLLRRIPHYDENQRHCQQHQQGRSTHIHDPSTDNRRIGYMNRDEFKQIFDSGIPWDYDYNHEDNNIKSNNRQLLKDRSEHVLVLYPPSFQNSSNLHSTSQNSTTHPSIYEDCNVVKVAFTTRQEVDGTCFIIAEHVDSYHVQKWVRQSSTPKQKQQQQQQGIRKVIKKNHYDNDNDVSTITTAKTTQNKYWFKAVGKFTIPTETTTMTANRNDATKSLSSSSSRNSSNSALLEYLPPKPIRTKESFRFLQEYLQLINDDIANKDGKSNKPIMVQKQLEPLLKQALLSTTPKQQKKNDKKKNDDTEFIIAIICNWDHIELLLNFVCAANKFHIDLAHRYVFFASDERTYDMLHNQLQLPHCFYNERLFPKASSSTTTTTTTTMNHNDNFEYGTISYAYVMLSKAYIAHLIVSCLGYNMLFHDVDIIPYHTQYIDYFIQSTLDSDNQQQQPYDMYFQYEKNDILRSIGTGVSEQQQQQQQYLPYMANTGFYYVKSNIRTKYFFSVLIRSTDLILRTKSHQAVVNTILNEHVSLFGLRVKTMDHISSNFPVGYHFHKDRTYMKNLFNGTFQPYAFHMNWNTNKHTKRQFNQQIGTWYVSEVCSNEILLRTAVTSTGSSNNHTTFESYPSLPTKRMTTITKTTTTEGSDRNFIFGSSTCCVANPIIVCHFRDKPSVIPCPDSPMIEDNVSFW